MQNNDTIKYKIGGQLWVQKEGENFMGPGRIALLEQLSKGFSLKQTASTLNMEYDIALKNIKAINKTSNEPLVIEQENGKYKVTKHGVNIINIYKKLKEEHSLFLEKLNKTFAIESYNDIGVP